MKEIEISGYKVQVDDEDVERIREHKWHLHRSKRHLALGIYYFLSSSCKRTGMPDMRLHRFIMNAPTGYVVDHIDRNSLNCCKSNLRITTQTQNIFNRGHQSNNKSGNRGIYLNTRDGNWHVSFVIKGRLRAYTFHTKESAQCVAEWIIYNLLTDRDVHSIRDTYGEFPKTYSAVALKDLDNFRNKTLRGIRKDSATNYRGVHPAAYGKFTASVRWNNKQYTVGSFGSEEEAAIAYDAKAFELLASKAKLNFPERVVNGVYNKEV